MILCFSVFLLKFVKLDNDMVIKYCVVYLFIIVYEQISFHATYWDPLQEHWLSNISIWESNSALYVEYTSGKIKSGDANP